MKTIQTLPWLTTASLALAGCVIEIGDRTDAPRTAGAALLSADLAVRFEGIETPTGQIMLSVYNDSAAHDQGGAPLRAAAVPVEGNIAMARFEGLAPGEYAIKAFHDVDGDGTMDTNPFGVPVEPYAFSNNAKAEGGPARWEAARFVIVPGANQTIINIK